jgi:hypothetical protein
MKHIKLFEDRQQEIQERQEQVNSIFIELEKKADKEFLSLIKSSFNVDIKDDINIFLSTNVTNPDYKSTVYVDILKFGDDGFTKNDFMESVKQAELSGTNIYTDFEMILNNIKQGKIYYRIEILSKYDKSNEIDKAIVNIGKRFSIQLMKGQYLNWVTLRRIKGRSGVISSEKPYNEISRKWYINHHNYKWWETLR